MGESETTEDPFQQTLAQFLQSAHSPNQWLGAHVIASAYNDATPGTVWGSSTRWGVTSHPPVPHPSPDPVKTQRTYVMFRTTFVSRVIRYFPTWFLHHLHLHTRPGETVAPAFLRAGGYHLRRRNKPCSRLGLQRMYRSEGSAITSTQCRPRMDQV